MNAVILGTGRMAQVYCKRLKEVDSVTLSAFVSRSASPSLVQESLGGMESNLPRVRKISELKALQTPPDLAVICLPSHIHRQAVEELAEFVPNLICEKPAALSLEDAQAMSDLAQAKGCNLMVAQVVRTWDSFTALAALLRQRRTTLHSLTLHRRQPRPAWSNGNWMLDSAKSGGILYDLAIHDVDFIANLFGPPETVTASFGPGGESVTLFLQYGTFCAIIGASWCLPEHYSAGVVSTYAEAAFTDQLAIFDSRWSTGRYQLFTHSSHTEPEYPTWEPYGKMLTQMLDLIHAGVKGAENPFSIQSVLPAMAVCKAALDGQIQKND